MPTLPSTVLNAHLPTQVSGPTSLPDTLCPQSCLSTRLHAGRCPAHRDTSPVLTQSSALVPMPGHLGPTPAFGRTPGHFPGLTPSLSAHRSNHGALLLRIRGSAASSPCSSGPWTQTPLSGCPLPPVAQVADSSASGPALSAGSWGSVWPPQSGLPCSPHLPLPLPNPLRGPSGS